MKISCENILCAFYEDQICVLDSVSLDNLGICEQMHLLNFDEDYLAVKRKKLPEKIEQLKA